VDTAKAALIHLDHKGGERHQCQNGGQPSRPLAHKPQALSCAFPNAFFSALGLVSLEFGRKA